MQKNGNTSNISNPPFGENCHFNHNHRIDERYAKTEKKNCSSESWRNNLELKKTTVFPLIFAN